MKRMVWLVVVMAVSACTLGTDVQSQFGVPERDGPPDLSQATQDLRENGGRAFIKITAPATAAVLRDLEAHGVHELKSYAVIHMVAGTLAPGGVEAVAERPYVTRISDASLNLPVPQGSN